MPSIQDPEFWYPENLFGDLSAFEEILNQRCGISLVDGESINGIIAHLLDLISALSGEGDLDPERKQLAARVGSGLADIVKKTVYVSDQRDFLQLCGHFKLFLKKSQLVQNVATLFDDPANKTFETLTGLSVLQFASDARVDDPEQSDGDNPDVLATVAERRWGFACKVGNTKQFSFPNYFKLVKRAVEQIQNSEAKTGFVLINLKNQFPHEDFWTPLAKESMIFDDLPWPDASVATTAMRSYIDHLLADWRRAINGQPGINEIFGGKRAARTVLNYVSTNCVTMRNDKPALTAIRLLIPLQIEPITGEELHVADLLNKALQSP